MRTVAAVLLVLVPALAAAQSPLRIFEMSTAGGFSDGPGYAARAPVIGAAASIGTSWLRVHGAASYVWLHKQGTPGGYQHSTNYSVETGARNAFVLAGVSHSFTDQVVYTKEVDYRFFGAGYRWAGRWNETRAVSINEVRGLYYRELRSTYANRTEMYAGEYKWDRQLRSALYVRLSVRLGAMYFDDNPYPGAKRRNGLAGNINIGLVGRP